MICRTCKEEKPITAFWTNNRWRQTQCSHCAYLQTKIKRYERTEYFARVRPNLVPKEHKL